MSGANDMNLKEMIQEAVKEALKEKGTVVATAKSKDKSSKDVQPLDATRGMGPHLQDPRCNPDQWPCYNQHVPWTSSNRFGEWTDCQKCGVRLKYIPRKGTSGQSTKMDLPANVVATLEHLRMEGVKAEDMDHYLVRKTLKLIVAQEALKVTKKTIPKSKAYPPKEKLPKQEIPPENIQIHSGDDEETAFSMVEESTATEKRKSKSSTTG